MVIRIPVAIIAVLFAGLLIYRFPFVMEQRKSQEVIKKIQSQKLTIADVLGQNLPPEPNALLRDNTVEGIDVNENEIRDDVELAIFRLHPDSARIRAAELQYAMALQNELSNVFNSETLVATMQEEGRSSLCIKNTVPARSALDSSTTIVSNLDLIEARINEVENLVINTETRKLKQEEIYKRYMTSYGGNEKENCDIDLMALSN